MNSRWPIFPLLPLVVFSATAQRPDLLIADFEGTDYGHWTVTGSAFGDGPGHGTLPGQMPVDGFEGKGLVNSFLGDDGGTGTLTSPPFTVERKFIQFLVGGGKHPGKTCVNLLVNGKVVRTATGPNDQPGGSERLEWHSWDVGEFGGQSAVIEIVDEATGGWGHINCDQIIQTDHKLAGLLTDATRELLIEKQFLNLPVRNGAPKRHLAFIVEGKQLREFDIELANAAPDWWAFMDLEEYKGKQAVLKVDKLPEDSHGLKSIEQSDHIKGSENLYREKLRPQFHFSSQRGWNNDPNGLVYYKGEYHLFYQHNPYGWNWGNMHWGHAVSRDLVHWKELRDALAPDRFGPMFSGSAVVDWTNSSGLGSELRPPLVLIYTAAGNPTVQCIASSTDGRHFPKYSGNPVVEQITGGNRDPKVFWHEPTKRWVMTFYVELDKVHTIHFMNSPNLKDWTYMSHIDGFFECPDFFALPVNDDTTNRKWVLTAASSEYRVGSFDGKTFTPETPKLPGHRGRGFYAAQTFSDIPASDGRRIQIGWFQTETRGMPFNQSMTIPLELKLKTTDQGPRLSWMPVKELASLRAKSRFFGPLTLKRGDANPLARAGGELLELRAEFEPGATSVVTLNVRGVAVVFDAAQQELIVNNHRAPAPLRNGKQNLTVFVDRTSLEVFASDGLTYVPMPVNLDAKNLDVQLNVTGEPVKFSVLNLHNLRGIWP